MRFLATEDLLTSSLASHVLLAVLQGLQIHGQHDANQVGTKATHSPFICIFIIFSMIFLLVLIGNIDNVGCSSLRNIAAKVSTNC